MGVGGERGLGNRLGCPQPNALEGGRRWPPALEGGLRAGDFLPSWTQRGWRWPPKLKWVAASSTQEGW
eukprot:295913-Chlamydomonas_euryale.AAC.3